MKKILIATVIILLILILAAVTNPSRDEFINWGTAEIKKEAATEIERVFEGAFAAPLLELQTEANDYVFFSIFDLKKSETEIRYLGIFANFFRLSK